MKYHNHIISVIHDSDVDGGKYYEIIKLVRVINPIHSPLEIKKSNPQMYYLGQDCNIYQKVHVTFAWTLSNAKEFIDTFDGEKYNFNVLA